MAEKKEPVVPPGFRKTLSLLRNCHTCQFVDRAKGVCTKYEDYPVKRNDVCRSWRERK